ncbi:19593_t:CDS:2, partial [Rhizophagus irregularis]
ILVSKNMDFSLEHKTQISVFKNTVSKNTGMCIETSSFEIYFEETWIQFLRIQISVSENLK